MFRILSNMWSKAIGKQKQVVRSVTADRPTIKLSDQLIDWKVLSVRQPYAWLIVNGYKDIENRSWVTPYRGPILIHAGKALDEDYKDLMKTLHEDGYNPPSKFDRGGIVGVATITGMVDRPRNWRDDWFTGPYGWVLTHAYPLPFVPLKGKLQLFTVQHPALLDYPPTETQTEKLDANQNLAQ